MTRQCKVLSLMLAGLAVLSNTRLYQPLQNTSEGAAAFKNFPERIGPWQSIAQFAPTADEVRLLETQNIMKRLYRDDRKREVILTLVYDPSGNRKMAHPQEVCLTGGGMHILNKNSAQLRDTAISAERLIIEGGRVRQLYYYWYKAGPHQSGNYMVTQARLALNALSGKSGGTALIRMNTTVTPSDESAKEQIIQDFAHDIMPELERYLR